MRKLIIIYTTLCFLLAGNIAFAQNIIEGNSLQFGIQAKPILPHNDFNSDIVNRHNQGAQFRLQRKSGLSAGLTARFFANETLGLETGINYVYRNYEFTASTIYEEEIVNTAQRSFGLSSFEIPLQGFFSINIWNDFYMIAALGPSIHYYPRERGVLGNTIDAVYIREDPFKIGIQGGAGLAFRTEGQSVFYMGASYQRPVEQIYYSNIIYAQYNHIFEHQVPIRGAYIALDFKFYLPPIKLMRDDFDNHRK